jgi:hypothetical protein
VAARLNAGKVIAGAAVVVFERWRTFCRALLLPFAALIVLGIIESALGGKGAAALVWLLKVPIYAVFAIVTHRIVLLGQDSVPAWGIGRWTRRETLFALHMLGMVLCIIPALVLGAGLGALSVWVGLFVAFAGSIWVFSRLSLVFPALAVDKGVSFGLSWDLTERHQWPMVVVCVVYPMLLGIPAIALSRLPNVVVAIPEILDTLLTVFTVAALSLAYREIHRHEYGN